MKAIEASQPNGGQRIRAKSIYSVGMDGIYLKARTYLVDEGGETHHEFWRWDNEKAQIVSRGFTADETSWERHMKVTDT